MSPVLRFAPSPTGRLHVGNISIALTNWLYARQNKGKFILRMDDTDTERSTSEFAYAIIEDLAWLGLTHDELHHQSDRWASYESAVKALKKEGRLYPCYETEDELAFKRKQQLARGKPPIYDRAALKLTDEEKARLESNGLRPHWRFKLLPNKIEWDDAIHGKIEFEGDKLSDPVLLREDGRPIYTLSSVVDDIEMRITHIFRGNDHLANTAVQIQLIEALGCDAKKFIFGHLPLLTDEKGQGLSKRMGSLSINHLRQDGVEAMAIICYLRSLGTSESLHLTFNLQELINNFDYKKITGTSPKFSINDLYHVNEKLLHSMPYEFAMKRLEKMELPISSKAWEVFRGNLKRFSDVKELWSICHGAIHPDIDEPEYLGKALEHFPAEPWNNETWMNWTNKLKEETGRKGKELFMPLRKALTGHSDGPEMKALLPLIGYKKAKARLEGKYA